MKRLVPLFFAFTLFQCRTQMSFQGKSYRLIPDCGLRGCGVSFYVSYFRHQDLTEVGFDAGKPYYRHSTFIVDGTYDSVDKHRLLPSLCNVC
jgi:hypothetical protein